MPSVVLVLCPCCLAVHCSTHPKTNIAPGRPPTTCQWTAGPQVPLGSGLFSLLDGSQQASPQVCVLWVNSLPFIQSEDVLRRSLSQSGRKPSTQASPKQDETQASSRHPRCYCVGCFALRCSAALTDSRPNQPAQILRSHLITQVPPASPFFPVLS